MKSYTDLEQSKVLAKMLPIESADMYWDYDVQKHEDYPMIMDDQFDNLCIPAWSLAALLDVLESEIDGEEGETYKLNIEKDGTWWNVWYREQYDEANPIETESTEEPIDACVEMILKLNEENLL